MVMPEAVVPANASAAPGRPAQSEAAASPVAPILAPTDSLAPGTSAPASAEPHAPAHQASESPAPAADIPIHTPAADTQIQSPAAESQTPAANTQIHTPAGDTHTPPPAAGQKAPAQTPAPSVRAPAVEANAQAAPAQTPAVEANAQAAPAQTPAVEAHTQATPAQTPTVEANAQAAPVQQPVADGQTKSPAELLRAAAEAQAEAIAEALAAAPDLAGAPASALIHTPVQDAAGLPAGPLATSELVGEANATPTTPSAEARAAVAPTATAVQVNAESTPAAQQVNAESAPAAQQVSAAAVPAATAPQQNPTDTTATPEQAAGAGAPGVDLGRTMSRAMAAAPAATATNNPLAAALKQDSQIEQTACATCGGFHSHADGPAFHESMGCANGSCIPGRQPCYPPCNECNSVVGSFIQNLYECLCCPDPCYQPKWVPAANASLFADYARPYTVTRFRYDNLEAMSRPDRNQFWIQQAKATRKNGNPINNLRARLQQFYIYQEAAGEKGSFFIEYPYRQINQSYAPTQAGFSDLNFGIKSLWFDCELLQVTFQFRTYTPTGNGMNNLGTGHFSLDPSILTSLKLGPSTYFQGQFGNWIPLGGNQNLAGGIFYWFMSLNQILWYTTPDSPFIATLEMDGWSFENGGYTNLIKPGQNSVFVQKGGGVSYFNIGPGFRQSICNRMDVGGAITFATNTVHWAQPWFRFEVRFLF
jgi:hypothetical protein